MNKIMVMGGDDYYGTTTSRNTIWKNVFQCTASQSD